MRKLLKYPFLCAVLTMLLGCTIIAVDHKLIGHQYGTTFQWIIAFIAWGFIIFFSFKEGESGPDKNNKPPFNPKKHEIIILPDGSKHIVDKLDFLCRCR